jgi:hypothetical protein
MIFISDIGFCFSHKRHLKVTSADAGFFVLAAPLDFPPGINTPF